MNFNRVVLLIGDIVGCMQTVDLPEIKSLGSYDVSIRLHPNVQGNFKVCFRSDPQMVLCLNHTSRL